MSADEQTAGVERYFLALQEKLGAALGFTQVIPHPVGMGDEAELNWFDLIDHHLPRRYQPLSKCFAVDHLGNVSHEIDLLICDRQYSTLVFQADARTFVPAEAVYAAFEVKPRITREMVLYAADKVASVRRLERTSARIVHALGVVDEPKPPAPILGGLLTFDSDWSPKLGDAFGNALADQPHDGRLDLGCVLTCGGWFASYESSVGFTTSVPEHALVAFYLQLLRSLQAVGTVSAMDFSVWSAFVRHQPRGQP